MDKTIRVLYDDGFLIIFDKPSGLLVIPSPKKEKNTLTDIVNRQLPDGARGRLHPCHRLDRETSGIIVFARGKQNQRRMMDLFHRRAVAKTYIAFVRGRPERSRGRITGTLSDRHAGRFGRKGPAVPCGKSGRRPVGKLAITDYRVLSAGKDFSVVEVNPRTGRTNQIRIHFRAMGHPLLGERVYAFRKDFPVNFRRLALHAHRISFRHPVKGTPVNVASELPEDMDKFLGKFSSHPARRG